MNSESRKKQRQRLRRLRRPAWLGTIRRTRPLSNDWGRDRGSPVDRYYIERFLAERSARIHGRVLEVMNSDYTHRFDRGVERSDVLDVSESNPRATIVADLCAADSIPSDAFDCFILTQTLQYVFDLRTALDHAHRILRPGGTVLCTVPAVSRIDPSHLESEFWRFTEPGCRRIFEAAFPGGDVVTRSCGNVLVACAFLMGMAREELSQRELEMDDPFFPVVITVQATKTAG